MRSISFWFYAFITSLLLLIGSSDAYAQQIAVPKLSQRVTDLTQTLPAQEQATLTAQLEQLEKEKGSQIAILIIPTIGEDSIENFSIRVVDEWKLGRKDVSDGVLFLIVKDDRKMRIEVGRGLEGAIPDVIAARIIREYVRPLFKQNDYVGGIKIGTEKLIQLVNGEELPPAPQQQGSSGDYSSSNPIGLPFFALILIILIGVGVSQFAGNWVGRGGVGLVSIVGAALTGATIGSAVILGIVMVIVFSIVSAIGLLNILSFMMHFSSGGGSGGSGGGGFGGGGGGFGGGGASGDW